MSDQRWADIIYSEAIGEKLSAEDEAFKRAELQADPTRLAEESALAALRGALTDVAPQSEDAAFARQSVKRANHRQRRVRQMAWTGAGLLAAAASVVIVFRMRGANVPAPMAATPSTLDGRGACIRASASASACFDDGSQLDAGADPGQLHLVRGHIVAALKPLPPGSEFSITTPHGKATVVGTQFAVDIAPDGKRTEVRVIRGKVKVDNASDGVEAFIEKGHFAVLGDHLQTGLIEEPTTERDRALLALAKKEAGITDDVNESALLDDAAKSAPGEGPGTEAPKAHPSERSVSAPASAADLLEEARRLRAGGQYEPSAEAYRRLVQRYPESAEARAAIVSLGQLELSQLGHPEAALHWFEKYLTSAGQLRQEAAYGKIQALQRLGRSAQERREIAHFLQEFPKSAQASTLRSRLDALGSDPH